MNKSKDLPFEVTQWSDSEVASIVSFRRNQACDLRINNENVALMGKGVMQPLYVLDIPGLVDFKLDDRQLVSLADEVVGRFLRYRSLFPASVAV